MVQKKKPDRYSSLLLLSIFVAIMSYVVVISEADAQTQDVIDNADRIQRDERQRIKEDMERFRQRRGEAGEIDIKMQELDTTKKSGEPCWEISQIVINGVTLLSEREQQKIIKRFTGTCMDFSDMNELLNEITKRYFEKGYVTTRAYIAPEQDLMKGRLEFLVVEGKLEDITLEDNKNNDTLSVTSAFPGMVGKVFNLRDAEQGIDQISRLPSNKTTIDIEPGKEPGGSVLAVKNEMREPFSYNFSADRLGGQSTGINQMAFAAYADNPMGLNDSFGMTIRRTLPFRPEKFSRAVSANYTIPFGYYLLSLDTSYSDYAIPVKLASGTIAESSGSATTAAAKVDRVLFRNQTDVLKASTGLSIKRNRNYFEGELIEVSSYQLTNLDVGLSYSTVLFGGMAAASLGYTRGLRILGATRDPVDQPSDSIKAQFEKYTVNASYVRPFSIGSNSAMFSSQFTGQTSSDVLYGVEQTFIGGYYTVRGFQDISIGGDRGGYWRNELSVTPKIVTKLLGGKGSFTPYIAYDIGRIFSHHRADTGTMSGMAYGFRANYGPLSLEITDTENLSSPSFLPNTKNYLYGKISLQASGLTIPWKEKSVREIEKKSNWFTGAEVGYTHLRLKNIHINDAAYKMHSNVTNYALSAGRKMGRSRLYGTMYQYDEEDSELVSLSRYNFTFETKMLNSVISPYAGVSVGYISYEEEGLEAKNPDFVLRDKDNVEFKDFFKLNGVAYGLKLGISCETKNLDMRVGYEYMDVSADDTILFDGVSGFFEIERAEYWSFSLSYKF